MTALGCTPNSLTLGQTDTVEYKADILIEGVHADRADARYVRRIEAEIPSLASVLGRDPVRLDRLPTSRTRAVPLRLDARRHSWSNGTITLDLRYVWSAHQGFAETSLRMRPTFTVTSRRNASPSELLEDWVLPFTQLLTIVTGREARPCKVSAWPRTAGRGIERMQTELPIRMRGFGSDAFDYAAAQSLIKADDFNRNPGGLLAVLDLSRRLATSQEVFLGLLSAAITQTDRPRRNQYLDVVAALEAYHAQTVGEGPMSQAAFAQNRSAIISEHVALGGTSADVRFLKETLPSRSAYGLPTRIGQLAKRLKLRKSLTVTPERMAQLRNLVAHGSSADQGDLPEALDSAMELARRILLNDLGIWTP